MSPLISNVSYTLYASSSLPMLGQGADMLRQQTFQRGTDHLAEACDYMYEHTGFRLKLEFKPWEPHWAFG